MLNAILTSSLFLYLAGTFAGVLAHAIKKVVLQQTGSSLVGYFFHDFTERSALMVLTVFSATAGLAASGQLDTLTPAMATGMGFLAGFTIDSATNRGAP